MSKNRNRKKPAVHASGTLAQLSAANDSGENADPSVSGATGDSKPTWLEPAPPRPNGLLLVSSGTLMIGWMIFLLYVAING
ncbi:MAG: hypothetical protein VX768_16695 [Planctomycetota bacterium]|nr:hypothetical protein [Planctomycetota bacterium]